MSSLSILETLPTDGYKLLDSGDGEKLEQFGNIVLRRPDPQALWKKHLDESEWKKADGHFTREERQGAWELSKNVPDRWNIDFGGLKFWIKPTAFKHTGIFPEQSANWDWMRGLITKAVAENPDVEVLNLFGYTGGATLAAAQAGAKVVHVDGSKSAITWARDNAEASGLADKPIRWLLDDARVFVEREIKRGRKYDAILMDPPAFGHGANKEIWKIEEHFIALVDMCFELLKDKPLFFLINGYSAGYSAIAYENTLKALVKKYGGSIEIGELAIREADKEGRLLPTGIFARWQV
ncbi:MAG: class I SAM-dependent methyltransferase [Patescibacteria group bacterium]